MNQFLWGALFATAALVSCQFFAAWRKTRDRLFAAFTIAFALLAVHWGTLGVLNPGSETRHIVYLIRFLAFAVIIAAIVDKNRTPTRGPPR